MQLLVAFHGGLTLAALQTLMGKRSKQGHLMFEYPCKLVSVPHAYLYKSRRRTTPFVENKGPRWNMQVKLEIGKFALDTWNT